MLAPKGNREGSKLSYLGHVLMENRSGLAVDCIVTPATGTAEREAALKILRRHHGPRPSGLIKVTTSLTLWQPAVNKALRHM